MNPGNLYQQIPADLPQEITESLLETENLKVERILSNGQCSAPGFWYDQEQNEWVLLVKGAAKLQFESDSVHLQPGDYLNIPAHVKHRVEWTTADEETIWLAIFY
jgi:cupin 2 domain-containing protein